MLTDDQKAVLQLQMDFSAVFNEVVRWVETHDMRSNEGAWMYCSAVDTQGRSFRVQLEIKEAPQWNVTREAS